MADPIALTNREKMALRDCWQHERKRNRYIWMQKSCEALAEKGLLRRIEGSYAYVTTDDGREIARRLVKQASSARAQKGE